MGGESPTKEQVAERVRRMPKAELHVHLEGSALPETVFEIAEQNGLRPPAPDLETWREKYTFGGFQSFLEVYIATCDVLIRARDYARLCEELVARQAAEGVLYTEAFLSASLFTPEIPPEELLDALEAAAGASERRYGSRIRFIPDVARHLPDTQRSVLEFAIAGKRRGIVVGIGLGGPEVGYPADPFVEMYREAKRHGLRLAAHAGETEGPESIRGVVDDLEVERIGHGVRLVEDPRLLERVRAAGLTLEVCPTSNYHLGVVPVGEPHPIRRLVDAGVACTVNSDDPTMFGTTLTGEYLVLQEQGFTWPELWRLNVTALEAAFLDPSEREALGARWREFAAGLG